VNHFGGTRIFIHLRSLNQIIAFMNLLSGSKMVGAIGFEPSEVLTGFFLPYKSRMKWLTLSSCLKLSWVNRIDLLSGILWIMSLFLKVNLDADGLLLRSQPKRLS
jgi:hypothetical protein